MLDKDKSRRKIWQTQKEGDGDNDGSDGDKGKNGIYHIVLVFSMRKKADKGVIQAKHAKARNKASNRYKSGCQPHLLSLIKPGDDRPEKKTDKRHDVRT